MQSIREIEKIVKKKNKQGYEGYMDLMEYLGKFENSQLDYLESYYKRAQESARSLYEFKDFIPLVLSFVAMFFSIVPDELKADTRMYIQSGISIVVMLMIMLILYLFLNNFPSYNIYISDLVLDIIETIREKNAIEEKHN